MKLASVLGSRRFGLWNPGCEDEQRKARTERERAQTIGGQLCVGREMRRVKVVLGSEVNPSTVSPTQLCPTGDWEDPSRGCCIECGNVHCWKDI